MTTVNERNVADKLMKTDDMKSAISRTTTFAPAPVVFTWEFNVVKNELFEEILKRDIVE